MTRIADRARWWIASKVAPPLRATTLTVPLCGEQPVLVVRDGDGRWRNALPTSLTVQETGVLDLDAVHVDTSNLGYPSR